MSHPPQGETTGPTSEDPVCLASESASESHRSPPPPPNPNDDPRLVTQIPVPDLDAPSPQLAAQSDDIFRVTPLAALKLLSSGIEALVRITGDIPPTPPPTSPTIPNMRTMEAEKENIVRSHSEKSLARLQEEGNNKPSEPTYSGVSVFQHKQDDTTTQSRDPTSQHQIIDGVRLRAPAPWPDPPSPPSTTPEPYIVIGANSQPLNLQHSAITRKFYSKKPPPISITDYLLRMHRFCPMSTGVYLATSLYIHRLAVAERAIAVTARNSHRLLLAGLRVAMKALEDLSYPHAKVAKVGGVSEVELARLEISFCFLVGFELVVGEQMLRDHWMQLRGDNSLIDVLQKPEGGIGVLRLERRPK